MLATAVYGVLTVLAAVLVAVAGLGAVQRLVPAPIRQEHNDVAGFIYAVVGVIYAVLLALMVIAVWEEHGAAKATVREEAKRARRTSSGSPTASPSPKAPASSARPRPTRGWWPRRSGP
jgi:protein-S-isoprenylcysteine O-methyltransferase Ste14